MKRSQNKAIAEGDKTKSLTKEENAAARLQTARGERPIATHQNTAAIKPSLGTEEIGRYQAAVYIRDMLIELQKVSRNAGVTAVDPALDLALATAIAQAETAVHLQQ